MGMFDTLLDANGHDWQTKAFDCSLETWRIGDVMPPDDHPATYQVRVLGDPDGSFVESFATVERGVLVAVPASRNPLLPLIDYHGGPAVEGI